jgi:hypothetical protein
VSAIVCILLFVNLYYFSPSWLTESSYLGRFCVTCCPDAGLSDTPRMSVFSCFCCQVSAIVYILFVNFYYFSPSWLTESSNLGRICVTCSPVAGLSDTPRRSVFNGCRVRWVNLFIFCCMLIAVAGHPPCWLIKTLTPLFLCHL